jgi:hypothetical protein
MRRSGIILAGSAVLAAVGLGLIKFWTEPGILAGSNGSPMFDLRDDGYRYDAAIAYLDGLSDTACDLYLGPQRWFDTGFPIGLAGFLALTIYLALYLALREKFGRWALVGALLPSAYFHSDMLENAAVARLLRSDAPTPERVELASTYTQLKFQLFHASALLLLLCLIGQAVKWSLARFREHP